MSTTKWIKTLEALRELDLSDRVKLLPCEQPGPWGGPPTFAGKPEGYMDGSGYSPFLILAIEWMEVAPRWRIYRADRETLPDEPIREIEAQLLRVHAPFIWTGSVIRIWGHQRRTDPIQHTGPA